MVGAGERIGAFCDQLSRWPSIADIARAGGAGPALDRLLEAWGGASAIEEQQILGWLDEIEEACARKGLVGKTVRGYGPLPPGISGGTQAAGWVCPRGVCERAVLASEARTAPPCAMSGGKPMTAFTASAP